MVELFIVVIVVCNTTILTL